MVRNWSAKSVVVGSIPTLESMEDKLDLITKNQEILNKNQLAIYNLLVHIEKKLPSDGKEFVINYIADIAGTVTAELGLVDILQVVKNKLSNKI